MSLKEMIEMHKKEKEEKKQARIRRKVEKKKTIEALTREQVEASVDIIELFKERIMLRAKCFETKDFINARIYVKDINLITEVMLEDFGKYTDTLTELCKSGQYEVKYISSVICIKTGYNTKMALDNLKDFARRKKENGVVAHEAREILKRYREKRIPAYDGFEVDYNHIQR